ncbi:plasmid mobilization protein [Bradyrhizobium brasilense]|uniref:plasmid mobilization protein n=1 Tax=Bradyrhizobium brasilense TaxID=1419277 RepID=UPI0011784E9B|nr:hypothetical protein [Bradyrhizobium brasilense]
MHHVGAERRRFRITFRVSALEHETLTTAADKSGLQLSSYVRAAALSAKPLRAARRPSVEATLLVRVLDRLGTIASTLRALSLLYSARSGTALPTIERDLLRSLSELRLLRPELLLALGRRPPRE